MVKKRRLYSDKAIEEMIMEDRGNGEGQNNKTWITVSDMPSLGRCTEILGWKTCWIHCMLSKLE